MQDAKAIITVVDDDPSVRKALARLVRTAGYEATAYESAEQFLSDCGDKRPDCLVLDVHLPRMSGLELQAVLLGRCLTFPIVFISAFSDTEARTKAIRSGAIDFLPKPVDTGQLLEAIDRALAS